MEFDLTNIKVNKDQQFRLGDYSKLRQEFDDDDLAFHCNFSLLLRLYENSAKTAYCTAKFAAKNGSRDDALCAQHFETVARTIESVIATMLGDADDDEVCNVPERPHGCRHE